MGRKGGGGKRVSFATYKLPTEKMSINSSFLPGVNFKPQIVGTGSAITIPSSIGEITA